MPRIAGDVSPEYRFEVPPAFPRLCTSLLNRVCDRFWEMYFDISTVGRVISPHRDANHYLFLAYYTYFSIFDRLGLQPSDVVADLGCGKGRVSCIAAHYRIRTSVGIEIDPSLYQQAQVNGARMRHRVSPLQFVRRSAADFNYDAVTVAVMFHPFGSETMGVVLKRWQESLTRHPRPFRVVYSNPILSPMLAATPFLQLYECWSPGTWSRVKFPVHFYRSSQDPSAFAPATSGEPALA